MSQRSGVVLFLTVGLAAVLASACGEDGDDDGGAGAGGSSGSSAGIGGKGGSSGSSAESGGTGGNSGTGASGGASGSSGAGGGSGKGGGGGVSGKGGAAGTGGKGGTSGTSGSAGRGGSAGAPDCEIVQCIRPIDCVEECGGPVLKSSCCPCDEGTFDNFECDGGSGGSAARRGFGGEPNEPIGGSAGAGFDLSDLNSDCVDDTCPAGLTPIHYYGVAGPAGPEFCSCSIPCDERPSACPDGTECVNVSDGPGNVCWVP
jgi:hypothetical protein